MIDSLETLYNDNDTLISEALNQLTNNNINEIISENNRMSLIHNADSVTKQALSVYYNIWKKGIYSLTASDSAALNAIAFDDPSVSGEGVYIARMLLDTIVISDPPQARLKFTQDEASEGEYFNQVMVFPNPNKGVFTVDLGFIPETTIEVKVFDMVGKEIFNNFQSEKAVVYSLERITSGIYLYVITHDNIHLGRGKLFIE